MSKGKRKKRRHTSREQRPRQLLKELVSVLDEADRLIEQGDPWAAIALLDPLAESHSYVPEVHYSLGYACAMAGDVWRSIEGCERALELGGSPDYRMLLVALYLQVEFRAHAVRAFRRAIRQRVDLSAAKEMREAIALMEQDTAGLARKLGLSTRQMEEGLYQMEEGQLALNRSDFSTSIAADRRATRYLRDWPPPHNNLSLALFFGGRPEEAIATARRVLSRFPDNVHALSNAVRFLAWTGQEKEARTLWAQLREIEPREPGDRLKVAEVAAALEEDEHVYRLLKPLDGTDEAEEMPPGFVTKTQFLLSVAEANMGRREARDRLKGLRGDMPWAGEFLDALEAGQPGLGWADRFPYFASVELVPLPELEGFFELMGREDDMSPRVFRDQVARFVERFPQIVRVAEKAIWEDMQPDAGADILVTVGTPAAYAALRRFGLSQVGDDDARMRALDHLVEVGEIGTDETLNVWMDGEWRETQIRRYDVSDEYVSVYEPEVAELLNEGLSAFNQEELEEAEGLFQRALELEPRAKQAHNNLGAIYSQRGEHEWARESFQAALEIDPLYVMPRCNLALLLLGEDDVKGAEEMLQPLADITQFHPQDMAFYAYTQARILIEHENYDAARRSLQVALDFRPDYELAKELLDQLDRLGPLLTLQERFASLVEKERERSRAKRTRLQAKLTTPDPSLSRALSLYTKDALTGMGNTVIPWGGWSGYRKAELIREIVAVLTDAELLEDVVVGLGDDERAALREVLGRGGSLSWEGFDARYGNDLHESSYWSWHTPETVMGLLRMRGLLVEVTVGGELLVAIPVELRELLSELVE
jgi:tetratricopeptide (TPR) repeat protein